MVSASLLLRVKCVDDGRALSRVTQLGAAKCARLVQLQLGRLFLRELRLTLAFKIALDHGHSGHLLIGEL